MTDVDILITNGKILTMDARNQVISEGAIAVKDGIILDIGSTNELKDMYDARKVLDATDHAVMPGLIDTYAHAGHAMIKGIWHPYRGWPAGELYFHGATKEFWYADALLAAVDRIRSGVTCGVSQIGATPTRLDDTRWAEWHAKGIEEVGIRDVIGVGPPDPFIPSQNRLDSTIWLDGQSKTLHFTYEDTIDNSIKIIKKWHKQANGRITVALTYPYICGRIPAHSKPGSTYEYKNDDIPELLAKSQEMRQLANQYGVQIHSHLYGEALEFALSKFGKDNLYEILGPDVVLAHCNSLTSREIEILRETDARVAEAPAAVSPLNYGRCPVPELIKAGVCVAISTDGAAPVMSFDMFLSIRSSLRIQRFHFQDPSYMPDGKLLRMVTIDAARALGMDSQIGSIEVGKKADIILLDLHQPHFTPPILIPQLLVYFGSGHDVQTVLIDGQIVMENRQLQTVDETHVIKFARDEITKSLDRLEQLGYEIEPYLELDDSFWNGYKQNAPKS